MLLSALFGGSWDYVPDFLTPQPQAPETAVQEELHAVTTTGSARLRWELQIMAHGVGEERLAGRVVPVVLRDALERGERDFLAASTVSYHLGILHHTGLIARTGQHVLYEQTPRAADLLAAPVPGRTPAGNGAVAQ
ncbi:hypothetical protein ACPC54_26860 [Kitasatospora sp. NPDC094028]